MTGEEGGVIVVVVEVGSGFIGLIFGSGFPEFAGVVVVGEEAATAKVSHSARR